MNEQPYSTKIEKMDIPVFVKPKEMEEKISLSKAEVENLKNAIQGEPEESKKIMLSVFPTNLLKEELKRRDDILNAIITQIKDFASGVDTAEELEDKQKKFEEFRKTIPNRLI